MSAPAATEFLSTLAANLHQLLEEGAFDPVQAVVAAAAEAKAAALLREYDGRDFGDET